MKDRISEWLKQRQGREFRITFEGHHFVAAVKSPGEIGVSEAHKNMWRAIQALEERIYESLLKL